jgi:hypothetical protein
LAVTDLAALMVTVQVVPEAASQPVQPLNRERKSGETLRVTTVSEMKETVQLDPQSIWLELAGLDVEVTRPFPNPTGLALFTVSGKVLVNVAVTVLAAFMVTVQVAPETVSHPSQPVNADPLAAVAVKVTTVPTS